MSASPLATILTFASVALLAMAACGQQTANLHRPADPIRNQAAETQQLTDQFPDGGLASVVGVQSIQVFRASRVAPELTDGKGWTYNHHVDMACWKGRLYIAWENGEKDEDEWPARELFSTSSDGITWTKPAELFPVGVSTSLRMYFFHAPSGHMLVIAGLRIDHEKLDEATKSGAVVREILPDHTLGPVYTLILPPEAKNAPPMYARSSDRAFVAACGELLANRPFFEQQDGGLLLGDRKMPWRDEMSSSFGKAFCFFHRKDGALVGIGKKGWVVVSTDEGNTWSRPVALRSFHAGSAKEWIQRTSDGRYAWLHDPFEIDRYPLVILTGDDGVTFRDMRVVYGELPQQRYAGENKNLGPQYVRGISEWGTDGSRNDSALWVGYSVNKEDIWVSRIPVPVQRDAIADVAGDFQTARLGETIADWNIYSPKWAPVTIVPAADRPEERCLRLEDRDPYDYARADRLFPASRQVTADIRLARRGTGQGSLEIELCGALGDKRPVRVVFGADGRVTAGSMPLGKYSTNQWLDVEIKADAGAHQYSVALNGVMVAADRPLLEAVDSFQHLTLRTGAYRGIAPASPIYPATDQPVEATIFDVASVKVR